MKTAKAQLQHFASYWGFKIDTQVKDEFPLSGMVQIAKQANCILWKGEHDFTTYYVVAAEGFFPHFASPDSMRQDLWPEEVTAPVPEERTPEERRALLEAALAGSPFRIGEPIGAAERAHLGELSKIVGGNSSGLSWDILGAKVHNLLLGAYLSCTEELWALEPSDLQQEAADFMPLLNQWISAKNAPTAPLINGLLINAGLPYEFTSLFAFTSEHRANMELRFSLEGFAVWDFRSTSTGNVVVELPDGRAILAKAATVVPGNELRDLLFKALETGKLQGFTANAVLENVLLAYSEKINRIKEELCKERRFLTMRGMDTPTVFDKLRRCNFDLSRAYYALSEFAALHNEYLANGSILPAKTDFDRGKF